MANAIEPQFLGTETQSQTPGSGKGCLWGCLIAIGLFVVGILCTGIGGYYFLNSQITKYTAEKAVELPTVEFTEEQLAELDTRVESFREQLNAGETLAEDLVLTADEINALIAKDENLRGKVFVKIEDNQVKGDVSFPLDDLPFGKGRFFNGSASFDVSMEGGVLIVTADQAEVNGEPVPEEFMEGMRQQNLAKDVYKDPENAKFMRQFEDIRIEDGKFVLRVKRNSESGDVQENPKVEPTEEETATEPTSSEPAPVAAE